MTLSELREAARYRVGIDSNLEWLSPAQLLALCDAAEALQMIVGNKESAIAMEWAKSVAHPALSALRDAGLEVT